IAMASAFAFKVRLHGSGGHGARASRDGNVILALSDLVPKLPGIVTGLRHEGADCSCSTGVMHAGTAPNVVPEHAELEGTLRTYTPMQAAEAKAALAAVCAATADEYSVHVEIEGLSETPAVTNDPAATATVQRVTGELFG